MNSIDTIDSTDTIDSIELSIAEAYRSVIKCHRKIFKPAHRASTRKWLMRECPELDRGIQLNRVLYDMNVYSTSAPYSTGICLSVAMFVQAYLKDVHNVSSELVGLYDETAFCHCVLKYNEKYFDTFWPEGTTIDKILHSKYCTQFNVDSIIKNYRSNEACKYLNDNLFNVVKEKLYSSTNVSTWFDNNCSPRTISTLWNV